MGSTRRLGGSIGAGVTAGRASSGTRSPGGAGGCRRLNDVDDFLRQVAVVIRAGEGQDFEALGDEVVAVAEVDLGGEVRGFGDVDWIGECDGDVCGGVGLPG